MPTKHQFTGMTGLCPVARFTAMTGLYLVAAKLSKRGFIVSSTSRRVQTADLLELSKRGCIVSPTSRRIQTANLLIADSPCKNVYAVQVKTNAVTFDFWLVSPKTKTLTCRNLVYALVNLRKDGTVEIYLERKT